MLGSQLPHCLEVSLSACFGHIQQEVLRKRAALDVCQDLLHGLLGLVCDDLRACDIIAVLRSVGNGISHSRETGLVDQIHDQLHLMDTFEVSISRIISSFHQCLKACLHQCAYTAAKYCLLAEQVCLCLCPEGRLQYACPCSADTCRISKRFIQCLSGRILLYRNQTGNALSNLIFTSHRMSRSLRSDHGHIHVLRRYDLSEMNIESVGKHEHVPFFQIRLNVLLVHGSLLLIIDQDHDDIRLLRRLCRGKYFKSLLHCLGPGSASFIKSDDDMASGFLQVQGMCMALAAISDDGNGLSFQHGKIAVFLIINFC